MRDYKKLEVWKRSHELNMFIKKSIATKLPLEEKYELKSQLTRAALSIPLNIVEGCGRFTDKDFAHFLDNALGSVNEVDYCALCAMELRYISDDDYNLLNSNLNEVRAMIIGFLKFLRENK
ncbi:four helix bundle protein [Pelobium manganitolerans]|uniref:four helix bundle protein n=1 Tax=Pelobium manganitolerans TaxID=1842495 RepID=UPI003FA3C16F